MSAIATLRITNATKVDKVFGTTNNHIHYLHLQALQIKYVGKMYVEEQNMRLQMKTNECK